MNRQEILYDHYKNSHEILCRDIKRRDGLMLFVLGVLAFFSIQALYPNPAASLLEAYLYSAYGINEVISLTFLGSLVWALLFIFSLRYFQTVISIERQYGYLHSIEEKINAEIGEGTITREGKSYLGNYPAYSNWIHFIYTAAFPSVLLIVVVVKIGIEWWYGFCAPSLDLVANTFFAVVLVVSIVLYLKMIHFTKRRDGSDTESETQAKLLDS